VAVAVAILLRVQAVQAAAAQVRRVALLPQTERQIWAAAGVVLIQELRAMVVQAWLFFQYPLTVIQAQPQARQQSQRQAQTQSYSSTLQVLTRRKSWLLKFKT
jgi:hypothetical protein